MFVERSRPDSAIASHDSKCDNLSYTPLDVLPPGSEVAGSTRVPRPRHERILDSPHTQPCFIPTQTEKTINYRSSSEENVKIINGKEGENAPLHPRVSIVNGHKG